MVVVQEPPHRLGVPDDQLPERPGQRLDHHVVAVGGQPPADVEGAPGVAGPAPGPEVERHRRDQRGPPPPPVRGGRPALHGRVRDAAAPPGRSRDRATEGVDRPPVGHPLAQPFHLLDAQVVQPARVVGEQLVGDPALLVDQRHGHGHGRLGGGRSQAPGPGAPDPADGLDALAGQGTDLAVDLGRERDRVERVAQAGSRRLRRTPSGAGSAAHRQGGTTHYGHDRWIAGVGPRCWTGC